MTHGDFMITALGFMILVLLFIGGCMIQVSNYRECKRAGFSTLYCMSQR